MRQDEVAAGYAGVSLVSQCRPELAGRLSRRVRDPANEAYLSVVSVWEAVIKHALGKLPMPAPPAEYLPAQREAHRIAALPLEEGALAYLANLPAFHRDPFDRILMAQALLCGLTLVTVDDAIRSYPVPLLPA